MTILSHLTAGGMTILSHLTVGDRKLIRELVRQIQIGEWSGSIKDIAEKFEMTEFDVMVISADLLYQRGN